MITKEQERLNDILLLDEFRDKIEKLIGEYSGKLSADMALAALEVSKLKLASFSHHFVIEKMKKEGILKP